MASLAGSLLVLLLTSASGYRTEAGIYELSASEVDAWHKEFIETLRMVQIYAPFLMKSKEFSPVYASISRTLKPLALPIVLGKVDMSKEENKPLMDLYKAADIPYLCFFRAGSTEAVPYRGEMTPEAIIPFLKKHIFHIETITEVDDFERIAGEENPIHGMLLAVVQSADSDLAKIFTQYAKENTGKFVFGMVEDKGDFAARFDLNSDAIIISRPFALLGKDDVAQRNITKAVSLKHFSKQVEKLYPTSISLWTHYNEDILLARGLPIITLYFDLNAVHNLPRVKYMANRLRRATEKFVYFNEDDNKFLFTIADRGEYMKDIERLQLTTNRVFLSLKTKEGQLYILKETQLMIDDQKIKLDAITKFVEAYLGGKLDVYVKSQDRPEEEFDRNVKIVVGETFKSAVLEEKKHVLLLIYNSATPDANLHETFSKVGELLSSDSTIVVCKIESTLNEMPSPFSAMPSLPRLLFLPSYNKYSYQSYEGALTSAEQIVTFVRESEDKAKSEEKKEEGKETEEKKEEEKKEEGKETQGGETKETKTEL